MVHDCGSEYTVALQLELTEKFNNGEFYYITIKFSVEKYKHPNGGVLLCIRWWCDSKSLLKS